MWQVVNLKLTQNKEQVSVTGGKPKADTEQRTGQRDRRHTQSWHRTENRSAWQAVHPKLTQSKEHTWWSRNPKRWHLPMTVLQGSSPSATATSGDVRVSQGRCPWTGPGTAGTAHSPVNQTTSKRINCYCNGRCAQGQAAVGLYLGSGSACLLPLSLRVMGISAARMSSPWDQTISPRPLCYRIIRVTDLVAEKNRASGRETVAEKNRSNGRSSGRENRSSSRRSRSGSRENQIKWQRKPDLVADERDQVAEKNRSNGRSSGRENRSNGREKHKTADQVTEKTDQVAEKTRSNGRNPPDQMADQVAEKTDQMAEKNRSSGKENRSSGRQKQITWQRKTHLVAEKKEKKGC